MASALSIPPLTTSTNLGPMTTPITFVPECLENLYDFQTNGIGVPWTYYTQGCALSTCCPYKKPFTTPWAWYTTYYSPAVCPYGYQTCSVPNIITTQFGESAAWCCPTGYECPTGNIGQGAAESISQNFYNVFCQKQQIDMSTSAFEVDNISDQNILTIEGVQQVYYVAYPLQIRWRAGDFATAAATSTTASASTSSPTSTSIAPTSTTMLTTSSTTLLPAATNSSQSTSVPSSTSTGLSTGAIAAIAVVVGIVILAALISFMLWMRWRMRKEPAGRGDLAAAENMHEADITPAVLKHPIVQQQRTELGPGEIIGEMEARRPAAELDTNEFGRRHR